MIPLTPDNILTTARKYLHTPFRHAGRTEKGLDCAGLLVVVARDLGMQVQDAPGGYSRYPNGTLLEYLGRNLKRVAWPDPGDVAVFWLSKRTKEPQHVGIVTESRGLIHCWSTYGKVVEVTYDPTLYAQLAAGYTWQR